MNKIKVFEAFAGYGGWSFGLKKANIDFDIVGYSEWDKYAIQCYEQNHNFDSDIKEGFRFSPRNYGDIKKIVPKELPDFDLFCASPPCQSFSTAGKGLGKDDERGDLFEYAINIMKVKQPKYAIYENVKGLVSKRHKDYFDYIIKLMKDAGYHAYWKVLNTKDYGVPQNRERVFIVCYRNDINKNYPFPEKEELKIFPYMLFETENLHCVNKTPSRDIMRQKCKNITHAKYTWTITLKQDRYPNAGIIDYLDYYRFLTPRECFRLQGFLDDDINLEGLSKTQQYKLAGNGLSINVVAKIFEAMFK